MRSVVLVLVFTLMGSAAVSDPPKDKIKEECEKLQGIWQAVSWVEDGENKSEEILKYIRWTFKGTKLFTTKAFTFTENGKTTVKGQGGTVETDYQIDLSKKHKVIRGTTVKPYKGFKQVLIYTVEGDSLKVCAYTATTDIPDEFSAGKGTGRLLITLKRKTLPFTK